MLRDYENQRIYKNFKIVLVLSAIAVCLSVISIILFLVFISLGKSPISTKVNLYAQILFYVFAVFTPFSPLSTAIKAKTTYDDIKENELVNDFISTLIPAVIPFVPMVLIPIYAYCFGFLLIPHIFLYISSGFLIRNCVLIKREWKDNPPEYLEEKRQKREEQRQENTANKNAETYETLIKQCGAKFFIKYYRQVKKLPPRDIIITENYSEQERKERIAAAKQLIDLGLSEYTLKQIQIQYREFLDESELETIQTILKELKND